MTRSFLVLVAGEFVQESELQLHGRLEQSHWWFRARREILGRLTDLYLRPRGGAMLDVGCGSGGNLGFLQGRFGEAFGVDVSPVAAALTREATGAEVFVGGLEQVPADLWPRLDLVLLADVLEHIEQDRDTLAMLVQRLSPGAILLITVPAHPSLYGPHDKALGHWRRYDRAAFRALWRRLPVDCVLESPFNCLLFPLILAARKLRPGTGSDLRAHSPLVNGLLYHVFRLEQYLLPRFPLPWGASYLSVLRKR